MKLMERQDTEVRDGEVCGERVCKLHGLGRRYAASTKAGVFLTVVAWSCKPRRRALKTVR